MSEQTHISCKVVMLPTKDPTIIFESHDKLYYYNSLDNPPFSIHKPYTPQHLYLISNQGIDDQEVGTLVWNSEDGSIYKTTVKSHKYKGQTDHTHTIVASTDTSLCLPYIQEEWIKNVYVPRNGKITEVMLQLQKWYKDCTGIWMRIDHDQPVTFDMHEGGVKYEDIEVTRNNEVIVLPPLQAALTKLVEMKRNGTMPDPTSIDYIDKSIMQQQKIKSAEELVKGLMEDSTDDKGFVTPWVVVQLMEHYHNQFNDVDAVEFALWLNENSASKTMKGWWYINGGYITNRVAFQYWLDHVKGK